MSNRVSRRQAGRWAAQEQQYEPQPQAYAQPAGTIPSQATDMDSKLTQLKDLGELKEQGVLSEAEFEAQKRSILNS